MAVIRVKAIILSIGECAYAVMAYLDFHWSDFEECNIINNVPCSFSTQGFTSTG